MERSRTELLGRQRYRHRRAHRIRRETRGRAAKHQGNLAIAPYAERRTALSTSVLPSDQIAPGTLWLEAITESNELSIQLQSSCVIVNGGNSFMVWLPWPETCVRIL